MADQYRFAFANIGWDVDDDGVVWNVGEGMGPIQDTYVTPQKLEEYANDPNEPLNKVEA